jgi:hypothetical protein
MVLLVLFLYVSIKTSIATIPLSWINFVGDTPRAMGGGDIDTASSVANKRWAVMMIGGARTYAFTRESFLRNVVNQTDPPMDIFVSTSSTNSCSVDWISAVLLEMDSRAWRYDELPNGISPNVHVQTQDRFQREQSELLQLIDDYAEKINITYDYIFYARPDLHYTRPMNIAKLEKTFKENGNGTIFTPECCAWGGWCDRLAVAHYKDFARMIKASDQWVARGVNGYYEQAFMDRGRFANLTRFDMHISPNLTEDYGFVTARLGAALEQCYEKTEEWYFWCDMSCNNYGPYSLNPTPAMCKYLNMSLAKKEGCRYYNATP